MSGTTAFAIAAGETGNAAPTPGAWDLRTLFAAYRWRILATYALFNLENIVRLAQPVALGLAISDLLAGSCRGLFVFMAQHLLYLLLSAGRRMYDTRAFTRIYTDLASKLVLEQRRRGVEVSSLAARSALSRGLVDFFERDVPSVFFTLYSVAGGLVMLFWYDGLLVPCCLGLLVPLTLLNLGYGRKTLRLTARLNDQLEQEVEVLDRAQGPEVRRHYGLLAHWRVHLSDSEAINFGLMELFVLGLMAVALVRACQTPGSDAGSIIAVFRYVLMFVSGLDGVPMLVQQLSRLQDIHRRLRSQAPAEELSSGPTIDAAGPARVDS